MLNSPQPVAGVSFFTVLYMVLLFFPSQGLVHALDRSGALDDVVVEVVVAALIEEEVVVDPDETLLIDLASDKVESDPWSNVKIVSDARVNEPGHWVMFDEQEEENMNYSFLQ